MKKKTLMNQFVIISVLITFNIFGNAQTFEKYLRTLNDDIVYDAISVSNEEVIFLFSYGNYNSSIYDARLYKINAQTGEFIDSCEVEFNFPDYKLNQIGKVFFIYSDFILVIGPCSNIITGDKQIFFGQYNLNLEKIRDTIVGELNKDEWVFDIIFSYDSLFVISGMGNTGTLLLQERDILGNLIRECTYSQGGSLASTVADIHENNKYHLYRYWDTYHSFYIINKEDLTVDTLIEYPLGFLPRNSIKDVNSDNYYVAGRKLTILQPDEDNLSFIKVNSEGTIIQEWESVTEILEYYSNNSFSLNDNFVYIGGTYIPSWENPFFFYPEQRWILLYKLTYDGDIIWQKFYKGEVHYMTYKILATADGGALIFSTRYDWNDPIPNQRDVHILKIDSTGYYDPITATPEEKEQFNKQILVYPNPADNEVNFVLGLYSNLQLFVYNSIGELKLTEVLPASKTIDILSLPGGVYFYLITGKNGFKETGKILKK